MHFVGTAIIYLFIYIYFHLLRISLTSKAIFKRFYFNKFFLDID